MKKTIAAILAGALCLTALTAVSYTHLDVYKRQQYCTVRHQAGRLVHRRSQAGDGGRQDHLCGQVPVSYTHLGSVQAIQDLFVAHAQAAIDSLK